MLSAATLTSPGTSRGYNFGEYREGVLYVRVIALTGTGPRLYVTWQGSPDANYQTGGRFAPLRAFATSLRATGMSALTLVNFGGWNRISYTVGGTSPQVRAEAFFVGKTMP
jgi:hypothetical protein